MRPGYEVEQPRAHLALLVAGQVDHSGQLLRPASALVLGLGRGVMPDVLVHPQGRDAVEAGLIGGQRLEQRLDRPPHGAPCRAELSGDPLHGRVFAAHLPDRPPARPRGQQRPRRRERVVDLGERSARAARLVAAPGALAPPQLDRPAHARHVNQAHLAAAVAAGHHTARAASLRPLRRLDDDPQEPPALALLLRHRDDMHAVQANEQIAAATVGITKAARSSARRKLGQRRGLPDRSAWSLPILGRP